SLARSRRGALEVVQLARAKQLPDELKAVASLALNLATWKDVRHQAEELFPLPAAKDNAPLPSIGDLVKRNGHPAKGKVVFQNVGNCANCHKVNGAGKEVGPDLSEIGKKLSREALYESILYPSASIAHNYESYVLATKNGNVVTGLLVSQTREEVTLKGADAIVRSFKKTEVESLDKSPISLMPADLHRAMTVQDLADVVEYLISLKEAAKGKQ